MLEDSKIKIFLPRVPSRIPLSRKQEFIPVIPTRRYNLLKIKDLCQLKQRDIRLGRVKTQSMNLQKVMRAQAVQKQTHEAYQANRNLRYRKMHNQSYVQVMQRMKEGLRVWSMEK